LLIAGSLYLGNDSVGFRRSLGSRLLGILSCIKFWDRGPDADQLIGR
jgi:hypothetical protein